MIFNTSEDIKRNVKDRITKYLKDSVSQGTSIDTNNIISLLRSYFYELKIREEIIDYMVSDYQDDYTINIKFQRNSDYVNFEVDLYAELRKMKIVKIQEHDNKNNLSKFFIKN
jgi:hypothetical protein